jgi:multidrug resistance efflux pump
LLKAQLHAANASLENLREEMEELQADNKRLGGQVRNAKAEVKKVAEGRRSGDNMQMVSSTMFFDLSNY